MNRSGRRGFGHGARFFGFWTPTHGLRSAVGPKA